MTSMLPVTCHALSAAGALDFVEDPVLGKLYFMRLLPPAEDFINGKQIQFRKVSGLFPSDGFQARTVVVLRGDFLTLGRLELLQGGPGDSFSPAALGPLLNDG